MVGAVFFSHIVDDIFSTVVGKVQVYVWWADSLGVQHSFENQMVFEGIHIGDAQQIRYYASGSRAPSRTDQNTSSFGLTDEISGG